MTQAKLVFLDAATLGDVSLQRFEKWPCTFYPTTSPSEVPERLNGYSIVVTNKVAINAAVLESPQAVSLKLIAVAATGTDIIDLAAARRSGVRVTNVPSYATQSVAQFTIALLLELASQTGRYSTIVKSGEWQKSRIFALLTYPTFELAEKKIGIVGYGNIGRAVARIGRALGMDVLVAARWGATQPIPADRLAFEEVLRQCDILSLHAPLTSETKHMINEQTLGLMKPTALLINTARGALIDEPALLQALRNQQLAGAALDVLSREPPAAADPVTAAARELDNLIVTPHTAWSAREARERLVLEIEQNVAAFLNGVERNAVV
jgi:glycerate dehydrogenase